MVFLLVVGFCVWYDLQSMQSMNKVLSVLKNKQYTINIHTLEVTVRFSESNWQRRSLDLISFFINTKAVESFALCRLKSAIPFAPWNHQSWKRILCVIYVALLAWGQRTDFNRAFYKLRWPGLWNLLSILVYAPALATSRLALHFLVPSV